MKLHRIIPVALLFVLSSAGCPTEPVEPDAGTGDGGTIEQTQVTAETREGFTEAVQRFLDVRRQNAEARQSWTAAQCQEIADLFESVSDDSSNGIAEAIYARGVTYQQCGQHDQAKEAFRKALEMKADYPPALIQLGLYALLEGNNTEAENLFKKAYQADITAYQAYINLAVMAFNQGRFRPGQQAVEGAADVLIGSALAVQADAVVALENLARFFFDYSRSSEANQRFRRFAQLVCQYAITKNALYAPIYNLRGLIFLAEENIRAAISDFRKATELDPDFYEAYMNYASLNLGFRGYQQAQQAYEQALRIRPDSYDALIGIGVAIRGLASEQESLEGDGEMIEGTRYTYEMAVQKYEAAKQLDAARPESYFNIGLIQHRFTNVTQCNGYAPAIATYQEALTRCRAQQANNSGVDYRALETEIQANLERAQKDDETLCKMIEMEAQAAAADAAMAEAERLMREQEAAAAAAAAAKGGTTPEGGGTTTPPEGGTPAPEGGTPAPEGGTPAPEGGTPAPEGAATP
jgi:tetratricopeptide (TPR) repeat protein